MLYRGATAGASERPNSSTQSSGGANWNRAHIFIQCYGSPAGPAVAVAVRGGGRSGVEAWVGGVASSRRAEGTAGVCQAVLRLGPAGEPWATTVKTGAGSRASGPSRIDVRGTRWLVAEAERAGAER